MRIVKAKYIERGLTQSYPDALRLLLDQVDAEYPFLQLWNKWREANIYNSQVAEVLGANVDQLRAFYNKIATYSKTKKKYYLYLPNVLNYFCSPEPPHAKENLPVRLLEKQCRFIYGMSKMPVPDESNDSDLYERLSFAEFIEFVCRLAEIKFQDQEGVRDEPFLTKLGYILDALFEIIKRERTHVVVQEDDFSVSDDADY